MIYKIYTDGGCSGNGYSNAIGGWGYFIINEDNKIAGTDMGREAPSTNQRMELTAAIEACKRITKFEIEYQADKVEVYSDSAYLINCVNQQWYINWQKNGWKNSKKEDVANRDLWEQLIPYFNNPKFSFHKVSGHSGDFWNEKVDTLTKLASSEVK